MIFNNTNLIANIKQIAHEIAKPNAAIVDQEACFPEHTFAAIKQAGALSAVIPISLGGKGCTIHQLMTMCSILGEHCASSAMIFAMHHIQVAAIVHHCGEAPRWQAYLQQVASEQRLIASVTSEVGPSGNMRESIAALEKFDDQFTLTKNATTISYATQADDLLITARRHPDAAASDQVLILAKKDDFRLEDIGVWDTLGMRGTCSPPALVQAKIPDWQVLPIAFGDIATLTMVPYSHILWAGCWLGIAVDAVRRARHIIRKRARKTPDKLPQQAHQLADVFARLQLMRHEIEAMANEYSELLKRKDRDTLTTAGFALRINNLKLSAARSVVDIVSDALRLSGIAAYMNNSDSSLGRHLRDAYSAVLMINEYRIRETNASLLMIHKGE